MAPRIRVGGGSLAAILFLLIACTGTALTQKGRAPLRGADSALDPRRFEPEIHAFEAADRSSPPPLDGVVPVLNRGFGGSTLADVVYYEDRILIPYRPRLADLFGPDSLHMVRAGYLLWCYLLAPVVH